MGECIISRRGGAGKPIWVVGEQADQYTCTIPELVGSKFAVLFPPDKGYSGYFCVPIIFLNDNEIYLIVCENDYGNMQVIYQDEIYLNEPKYMRYVHYDPATGTITLKTGANVDNDFPFDGISYKTYAAIIFK